MSTSDLMRFPYLGIMMVGVFFGVHLYLYGKDFCVGTVDDATPATKSLFEYNLGKDSFVSSFFSQWTHYSFRHLISNSVSLLSLMVFLEARHSRTILLAIFVSSHIPAYIVLEYVLVSYQKRFDAVAGASTGIYALVSFYFCDLVAKIARNARNARNAPTPTAFQEKLNFVIYGFTIVSAIVAFVKEYFELKQDKTSDVNHFIGIVWGILARISLLLFQSNGPFA